MWTTWQGLRGQAPSLEDPQEDETPGGIWWAMALPALKAALSLRRGLWVLGSHLGSCSSGSPASGTVAVGIFGMNTEMKKEAN